jgi:hypothetical protein
MSNGPRRSMEVCPLRAVDRDFARRGPGAS